MFSTRDLGPAHFFLGIELIHNSIVYILSQSKYILTMLCKVNFDTYRPVLNPCPTSSKTSNNAVDPTTYQSKVGDPQYLKITQLELEL